MSLFLKGKVMEREMQLEIGCFSRLLGCLNIRVGGKKNTSFWFGTNEGRLTEAPKIGIDGLSPSLMPL